LFIFNVLFQHRLDKSGENSVDTLKVCAFSKEEQRKRLTLKAEAILSGEN